VRLAFADFLARHTGDEYAAWYATEGRSLMLTDIELRLERMVNSATYSGSAPEKIEKLIWYRDAGEAVMHSSLDNPGTDLALSFRSSRYGCVNHTYANQNSFNLAYRGRNIFANTGYYFKYGSRHHLTDSRHTRAHNTILVNGVGQAFANEAYGQIVRGAESDHIVYCLGDASHAYADTSHIDAWVRNIAAAGLTQTPADGFGATPLTRYLRHCVMLGGDIAVIYDEIEASAPVTIDWLLNSPVRFSADMRSHVITSENSDGGFAADCRLFASQPMTGTLTDRFVTPPGAGYPDQWHFAARTGASAAQRFLFIVKVRDRSDSPVAHRHQRRHHIARRLDHHRLTRPRDTGIPAYLRLRHRRITRLHRRHRRHRHHRYRRRPRDRHHRHRLYHQAYPLNLLIMSHFRYLLLLLAAAAALTLSAEEKVFADYFDIPVGSGEGTEVIGKIHLERNKDVATSPIPAGYNFVILRQPKGEYFDIATERDSAGRITGVLRVKDGVTLPPAPAKYPVVAALRDGDRTVQRISLNIKAVKKTLWQTFYDRYVPGAIANQRLYGRIQPTDDEVIGCHRRPRLTQRTIQRREMLHHPSQRLPGPHINT